MKSCSSVPSIRTLSGRSSTPFASSPRRPGNPPWACSPSPPCSPWSGRAARRSQPPAAHLRDLRWADYVFLGGMAVQADRPAGDRALQRGGDRRSSPEGRSSPRVTGLPRRGPLRAERGGDHAPRFLEDLRRGHPGPLYTTPEWADITTTPLPMWELIDPELRDHEHPVLARLSVRCEFCDITVLFGHLAAHEVHGSGDRRDGRHPPDRVARPPVLRRRQTSSGKGEAEEGGAAPDRSAGWRSTGTRSRWGPRRRVNLSDDPVLMDLMARAGFEEVFVGSRARTWRALEECRRPRTGTGTSSPSVRTLQKAGLQVQAGFIVGFDSDLRRSSTT